MALDVQARKILELLSRYQGALSGKFIAKECGIRESRLTALLEDLEARGYVEQITFAGFWRATPEGRAAV